MFGTFYLLHLAVVHGVTHQRLPVFADALDIDTYGTVADDADDALTTMADVEMDVRMADDKRFAVFTIFEDGAFRDAVLLLQALTQQQIGHRTGLTALLEFELQGLFAALVAQ